MKIIFHRIGTILSRQFYDRAVLDFVGVHWGLERKRCNHYWATLVGRWILIFIFAWFFSLLFVLDIYVIIANHCLGRFDWYDSSCSCIYSYPSIWGSGKVYIVYQHVRLASTWKLTSASWWVSQDVGDVLAALDYVIENGMADPAKVAVLGGSHGGFLASHLIGQVKASYHYGHILY